MNEAKQLNEIKSLLGMNNVAEAVSKRINEIKAEFNDSVDNGDFSITEYTVVRRTTMNSYHYDNAECNDRIFNEIFEVYFKRQIDFSEAENLVDAINEYRTEFRKCMRLIAELKKLL